MAEAQRTSLFERHQAAGARFVEFGGWTMPVQYRGLLAEHEAVRARAGLFDVSHMGEIEVEGEGALSLCQGLTTNDAAAIPVGRAQYTLWCTETGGTIDDTILYRLGEDRYLFCVNASNRSACWEWIRQRAAAAQGVHPAGEHFLEKTLRCKSHRAWSTPTGHRQTACCPRRQLPPIDR